MRGIQKVRSPTQLTTRYAHHILSLLNIDTCNWNALGPAFLQRSDTGVEELLFLVLQPAICHADNVLIVRRCVLSWIFFSIGNKWTKCISLYTCANVICIKLLLTFSLKQRSLGARTTHLLTRQLKHWLPSKMPALNYSVTHHICNSYLHSLVELLIFFNSLSHAVVDVDSVDLFKSRLDNFWMSQDVKYDYTVNLASPGDQSEWHWKLLRSCSSVSTMIWT